jgi:hypothetical protein
MARTLPSTLAVATVLLITAVACSSDSPRPAAAPVPAATAQPSPSPPAEPAPPATRADRSAPLNRWVTRRPAWLGTRVLPLRPDGFGVVRPTPAILRNRRLPTTDLFPRPKSGRFAGTIGPVPRSVVARSTWRPKCPVSLDQLSYLTMTFWGFDHRLHTGEMIVNASVDEQIVGVFRALYEARFPIEEMRVVTLKEQRAWHTAPTGDTNVTSSFECRQATLGRTWSQHAYGLAVDINPFHNPYLRGELVAPELAGAYSNREWRRPGMILEGDIATRAFDAIGWGWGGRWNSLKDWMHFSQTGH